MKSWLEPQPHITTVLRLFFWDHPGEPVPEENLWTLWCKGRLTEAVTPTIWLGVTPYRLSSLHLHHPHFYRPSAAQPTVSKHGYSSEIMDGKSIFISIALPYESFMHKMLENITYLEKTHMLRKLFA